MTCPLKSTWQNWKRAMLLNRLLSVAVLVVALMIAISSSVAQDTPIWVQVLRAQLLEEQECELNYMTNIRELELGDTVRIDARAHCKDGRAFDVKSDDPGQKFDIRACNVTLC